MENTDDVLVGTSRLSHFLPYMMTRFARANIQIYKHDQLRMRRTASLDAPGQIELNPDKLYLLVTSLHWEDSNIATESERKLYGVNRAYSGQQNGDFFEGGRNVVWECRACRKPFLKYPENDNCPHCQSKDINDWEADMFGRQGELLTRTASGKWAFDTWRGCPVHENHNEEITIGTIEDVWPEPDDKAICEMLSIDRRANDRLARKIEAKQVEETSMGVLVGSSICGHCFNVSNDESRWCECLKKHKGRIHPRTGRHVFEILKNIQGAEHSIISVGYGADPQAKLKVVLASANTPPDPSSTTFLLQTQENDMPEIGKHGATVKSAGRSITKTVTASSTGGGASGGGGGANIGKLLSQSRNQLAEFGNIDSSRIAGVVEGAVAATQRAMTPTTPAELRRSIEAQIKQLAQTDPEASVQMKKALTALAKPWKAEANHIKSALYPIAQAIGGKRVAAALASLNDPEKIKTILVQAAGDKRSGASAVAASGMMEDATDAQVARIV
ncbi:MAG: hypothetical protein WCP55_13615, partial [Lentisphaerota bacterium]